VAESFTNALLAFNQGRSDALMWDDTVLVGVAAAYRSAKLTNDLFLVVGSESKDSHGDHLESLQEGRELRGCSDARSSLRPLQVHVPAARNRRVPAGARRHQRFGELQGVRAAPTGANGPRRLDVGGVAPPCDGSRFPPIHRDLTAAGGNQHP